MFRGSNKYGVTYALGRSTLHCNIHLHGAHKRVIIEHVMYRTHMRRIVEGKVCMCVSCYYVVFKIVKIQHAYHLGGK